MLLIWLLVFALLAIVSGVLGFTRLSAAGATIAKFPFSLSVVVFILLLVQGHHRLRTAAPADGALTLLPRVRYYSPQRP